MEFPNKFDSKEILQSNFVNLRTIRSLAVKYTKQQYCKHAIQYRKNVKWNSIAQKQKCIIHTK